MKARTWALLVVTLAAIALFIPFVPQTRASGRGLGVQYQQTAVVSPAYYAFHCGSFINSQFMVHSNWGLMGIYQISKGYTFSCYYSSAYQN